LLTGMLSLATSRVMCDMAQCTATAKRTGERCRREPVTGLEVCRTHGGASRQSRAKSRAVVAKRGMGALADPVGPLLHPLQEILLVAARARRLMELMEARCAALQDIRYATATGEQTRAELAAYERSLDRLAKFLETIMRLDIDSRLARVSERQADVMVEVIRAAMVAGGLRQGTAEWDAASRAAGASLRRVNTERVAPPPD